jgi:hypothetical protein
MRNNPGLIAAFSGLFSPILACFHNSVTYLWLILQLIALSKIDFIEPNCVESIAGVVKQQCPNDVEIFHQLFSLLGYSDRFIFSSLFLIKGPFCSPAMARPRFWRLFFANFDCFRRIFSRISGSSTSAISI